MKENREGDLKDCECLHSDCTSLDPSRGKREGQLRVKVPQGAEQSQDS